MKNIQTGFLKIISAITLLFLAFAGNAQSDKIKAADSLFKSKQYTQSLELYQEVFNSKKYSPAMLLKMAYINEGLGKTGATLYYLKLYHLATNDDQALKKTEELASKFKLSGYDTTDNSRLQLWIVKNVRLIQAGLAILLLATGAFIFMQRKQNQKPWAALAILVLVSVVLFYSNNVRTAGAVIVSTDKTYVMEGPSAGAGVAAIIGEGSLLESMGREDIWVKVKWMDKIRFIKENSVLEIAL
ncbi:hypothetical protein WSM22_20000 [Cytophagales bacterium WSM2-2]|nr:hypothetical protein WSM22_20000 [Cytophagales bacterium WSM2-2]